MGTFDKMVFPQKEKVHFDDDTIELVRDLKASMVYAWQSLTGRHSLEAYLDILSSITDQEIKQEQEEGKIYKGGKVRFYPDLDEGIVDVALEMVFFTNDGKWEKHEARRAIAKESFTDETLDRIKESGVLEFEIEEPES